MTVRTRFAPSPTGYMHIGGMRTALFNWLYARRYGGQFILRIDDTDQQRNIDAALAPILQAFRWLGLNWDEGPEVGGPYGPYFQSQRGDLYQAAAARLLAEGKAYRCFDSVDEVQADKQHLRDHNELPTGMRRSLELSDAEIQARLDRGDPWVLRFKVPHGQTIAIDDEIRGHVEWNSSLMFDPNISRSNGSPLYNFATVVDDAQLKITHVIRAEEHLSNTAIQVLLYEALGEPVPTFAHIPFVMAPGTSKKISKRDIDKYRKSPSFKTLFDLSSRVLPRFGVDEEQVNPVAVEFYEQTGFLQAGLLNSLGRTGWSFDETTEFMSLGFLIEHFSLDRVVKSAAAFDPEKLMSYQAHWMNELSLADRSAGCLKVLQRAGLLSAKPTDASRQHVTAVVAALADRIKVFTDILTYEYFFRDEIEYSEKDFQKRVAKDGVPELLAEFRTVLAGTDDWSAERLETELLSFVETRGLGAGLLIHALRIAVTGSPTGPGLYDCLVIVGKETVLRRIGVVIERAAE
ncbi:glutamate--tRNA ligase [bacterium]|nr:glutamate--tRNA ligase [bacterium]